MFIFDVLIYVFFAIVMCYLAKKSVCNTKNGIDLYLWCYIAFFTLISAIRWGVGTDSISYAAEIIRGKTLYELINGENDPEIIMSWIIRLIHYLGLHFSFGLGFLACIQIFFLVQALKTQKELLAIVPIVMFGSHYFLDLMNGVRQMTVACVFFWAVKYIYERKALNYFIVILISSYLHKSAVILLPLYFIPVNLNLATRRKFCLIAFLLCFFIGLSPQLGILTGPIQKVANLAGYSNYSATLSTYLSDTYSEETRALGPMQLSYFFVAFISILCGPALHKRYSGKIPYFNLWYLFSYSYICLYFLVCNISHILLRPIDYFCLFHMIIVSLLLYDVISKSHQNYKFIYYRIALIFVIWMGTGWSIFKSHYIFDSKVREYTTYKVFFMHQDEINKLQ